MDTKRLVALLEEIAPLSGAEPWDNPGLLLEPRRNAGIRSALLTIDLTPAVAAEALRARADAVVAYHPPIFHPLRALTRASPVHAALLDLAAAGVAVYSPHSALDAAPGGVNDWLAAVAGEGTVEPLPRRDEDGGLRPGSGRRNALTAAVPVTGMARRLAAGLGSDIVRVARGVGGASRIRTVAVCAGAGASALRGNVADAWITGEMGHHDLLAATQAGIHVFLCEHTRTERGYLPVYARRIREASAGRLRVRVSRADRCPLALAVPAPR